MKFNRQIKAVNKNDSVNSIFIIMNKNLAEISQVRIHQQNILERINYTNILLQQLSDMYRISSQISNISIEYMLENILMYFRNFCKATYRWIQCITIDPKNRGISVQKRQLEMPICQNCKNHIEALKIRHNKQQLLGKEKYRLNYRILNPNSIAQQQDDDFFMSYRDRFWQKIKKTQFQQNQNSLYPKAESYISHILQQQKLKNNKTENQLFQLHHSLKQFPQNCIDNLFQQFLSKLKKHLSKTQMMQRISKLIKILTNIVDNHTKSQQVSKNNIMGSIVKNKEVKNTNDVEFKIIPKPKQLIENQLAYGQRKEIYLQNNQKRRMGLIDPSIRFKLENTNYDYNQPTQNSSNEHQFGKTVHQQAHQQLQNQSIQSEQAQNLNKQRQKLSQITKINQKSSKGKQNRKKITVVKSKKSQQYKKQIKGVIQQNKFKQQGIQCSMESITIECSPELQIEKELGHMKQNVSKNKKKFRKGLHEKKSAYSKQKRQNQSNDEISSNKEHKRHNTQILKQTKSEHINADDEKIKLRLFPQIQKEQQQIRDQRLLVSLKDAQNRIISNHIKTQESQKQIIFLDKSSKSTNNRVGNKRIFKTKDKRKIKTQQCENISNKQNISKNYKKQQSIAYLKNNQEQIKAQSNLDYKIKNIDNKKLSKTKLPSFKKLQVSQNLFTIKDLQLFGGISQAYKYQIQMKNHETFFAKKSIKYQKIEQKIELIQKINHHLFRVSKFQNKLYDVIMSYLVMPYQTTSQKILCDYRSHIINPNSPQMRENHTVLEKICKNILFYLYTMHLTKCGTNYCIHFNNFIRQIQL